MKLICLICLAFIMMISLSSCNVLLPEEQPQSTPEATGNVSESENEGNETDPAKHLITASEIDKIKENMMLTDIVSILGPVHYDSSSTRYPFSAMWETDSGGELTVKLESADYEAYEEKKREGEESGDLTAEMISGWYMNSKAVSASIWQNGELTVLFKAD